MIVMPCASPVGRRMHVTLDGKQRGDGPTHNNKQTNNVQRKFFGAPPEKMDDDEYAYLQEGFNSRNLRKDDLRKILLTHDVHYTNDMLKPKLMELYQTEIVPRRAELRKQFLEAGPSANNIENATPPRGAKPPVQLDPAPAPQRSRSPRSPRSRSPRRVTSRSRATPEPEPAPKLQENVPSLAPDAGAAELAPEPKPTPSPRRRRGVRKVEVPTEAGDVPVVPKGDVKLRAPRSPRKKRSAQHLDEESFTDNNVFQSGSKKHKSEPREDPIPPVTEADIGYDLPLDADLVADLNAEMDRFDAEAHLAANSQPVETPEPQHVEPDAEPEPEAEQEPELQSESQSESQPEPQPETQTQAEQPAPQLSTKSQPRKEAAPAQATSPRISGRRRGFMPSLAELDASRRFAEQLEPLLVPSPIPTPRQSMTPAAEGGNSPERASPQRVSPDPEPSMLLDAEELAARDMHDVLEKVPSVQLPNVQLPNVQLPNMQLPNMQLPNVQMPNVHLPEVHLPEVHLPDVTLPKIPRHRLPSFSTIALSLVKLLVIAVLIVTFVLFGLVFLGFASWYRDAYSSAQFCDVGLQTFHEYPSWALYDTGYPIVSDLQERARDIMDDAWPECLECPENAKCYPDQIVLCASGYSQLARWPTKVGLVKLPPLCVPDWETQRKMDALSERAAEHLRQRRADVACDGDAPMSEEDLVVQTSLSGNQLKERLLREKSELLSEEEFNQLWEEVVDVLPSKYADVYVVSDPNLLSRQMLTPRQTRSSDVTPPANAATASEIYPITPAETLAHPIWFASNSDARVTLSCRLRRSFFSWVQAHRQQLVTAGSGIALFGFFALAVRRWLRGRRRQHELVQSFLDQLQLQRDLSTKDPRVQPYLRTTELRSQVPRAAWPKIQAAVESHQSVRARQIEVYGEIMRIWEWTS